MSNIKFFATTNLFWQSLEQYAGHPLFPLMRRKMRECVQRKLHSPNFRNARDKPFDVDPRLAGIWHCKLTDEIDAVLFYRIHGDTLYLCMMGSHHDYPADGRNGAKANPLAEKLKNAVAAGHVDHPARAILKWITPKDLIGNPLLDEIDVRELAAIREILYAENVEGAIFRKTYGYDILEAPTELFDTWLREVLVAHIEIERAIRRVEMGAISRKDRREIASIAAELAIDPDEILRRDGVGFTVPRLIEAVLAGARLQGGRHLMDAEALIDFFESEPEEHAQSFLLLARRKVHELSRKSHEADAAAYEIERLLVIGEVVLSDPGCREWHDWRTGMHPSPLS